MLCVTCFHFELGSSVALMRPIAAAVGSASVSGLVIALARDLRINHPGIPDLGRNKICPLTDISGIQLRVVGLWNFVCWLGFLWDAFQSEFSRLPSSRWEVPELGPQQKQKPTDGEGDPKCWMKSCEFLAQNGFKNRPLNKVTKTQKSND